MIFSKVYTTSLTALAITLAAGCAANSTDLAAHSVQKANSYLKPGASVNYSHNLKSQLSVGESTIFKLTLKEYYGEGQLAVNLAAEGDISLFTSSTQASFDMTQGPNHEMDVSLTARSNGRHYINVVAQATNDRGQSSPRIFSIPVQVGPVIAQKPNENMITLDSGENIISMEAQEVIK